MDGGREHSGEQTIVLRLNQAGSCTNFSYQLPFFRLRSDIYDLRHVTHAAKNFQGTACVTRSHSIAGGGSVRKGRTLITSFLRLYAVTEIVKQENSYSGGNTNRDGCHNQVTNPLRDRIPAYQREFPF